MYKILSKYVFVFLALLIVTSCISDDLSGSGSSFTEEQENLIRSFFMEQGSPISGDKIITLDRNGNPYIYTWYSGNQLLYYYLLVNDTAVHRAVLSETINRLTAVDTRFRGVQYGYSNGLKIDSIMVVTDSVITLKELSFWRCNLNHLPLEIGKVRTQTLDLSMNDKLKMWPEEIQSMDSLPQPYDILYVKAGNWSTEEYLALPQWLQDWRNKHNFTPK